MINSDLFLGIHNHIDCQDRIQAAVRQLAYALQSNQALQASAFVGTQVIVPGNIIKLEDDNISSIGAEIPETECEISIFLYTESSKLVRTIVLEHIEQGCFEFQWDGLNQQGMRVPKGKYTATINCRKAGKTSNLTTLIAANVNSVNLGQKRGDGVRLSVADIGEIRLDQVIGIGHFFRLTIGQK